MPFDSQEHYLIRHYKSLSRFTVLGLAGVALFYIIGLRFIPATPLAVHIKELVLGIYLFSVLLVVLKSTLYQFSSGETLQAVYTSVFGFQAFFVLLNTLGTQFSPTPGSPLFWAGMEFILATWMLISLGWFWLQEPQKQSRHFRRWLLITSLTLALAYTLLWLLTGHLAAGSGWRTQQIGLMAPLLPWLLTYLFILRRWQKAEPNYFTFSIALGMGPHLLAYLLESLRPSTLPYIPSALFWILSFVTILLMYFGLVIDFILLREQTQKANDLFHNSQKEMAEHTRRIEQMNQELENQMAQHQIQADLNSLLTLSLANTPLKEMLHSMLGYLTGLPWLAMTGGWGIYLRHTSKEVLRLRYKHDLPEKWNDHFPSLMWPQCLCGHRLNEECSHLQEVAFPALPGQASETYLHYGIALQTTEHEPVGHLILLATQGASSDGPTLTFLSSVAQILVGVIQRKQAEDELRQERDKMNQYLNNAGLIFVILNPNGTIQMVNQKGCDLLGYPMFELLGKDWVTLALPARVQPDMLDMLQNLVNFGQKGMDVSFEDPILTRDGNERLIAWHATVIKKDDDSIQAILASGEDITEKKRLQTQLLQSQKLESIGQLAAGIAHEINTPTQYVGDNIRFMQESFQSLSGLIRKVPAFLGEVKAQTLTSEKMSELESALEKADVDYLTEEIPKAIEQSLEGVTRVSTIVRAMKEFAHPDAGEKTLTDLNHAIESTITISRNEWKYVADTVTDFAADLPLVPLLPGEFNQVILNMIVNAAHAIGDVIGKHEDHKGTITFRTRRLDEFAEVSIEDTGTGIPKEHLSKIFDPFFTTKKVGRGTGQGLAISHNVIVEKLKGTIDVKSEVGHGTTFILRLPLNDI